MSGTDTACGTTCLRACYAAFTTETAYGAPRAMTASGTFSVPIILRACYAVPGTDLASQTNG
eukprot:1084607-Rhodomonas_salina.4